MRIIELRKRLKLSQAELGRNLGSSAMAVSRWERGQLPGPGVLIRLGILSGKSDCWFFWTLTGLTAHDVTQVLPPTKAWLVEGTGQRIDLLVLGRKKRS
jgi:transcriptional regulator with XRE-family HTH domain